MPHVPYQHPFLKRAALAAIALGVIGILIILQMAGALHLWPINAFSPVTILASIVYIVAIISYLLILTDQMKRHDRKPLLPASATKWVIRLVWLVVILRLLAHFTSMPDVFALLGQLLGLPIEMLIAVLALLFPIYVIAMGTHALAGESK